MDTLSIVQGNNFMVFANWALVITTMVLALITFFYMRHTKRLADDTKRMADIMAQEFESKIAPIIQIEKRDGSLQGDFGSRNFEIMNKGSLPVHIAKIVLEWWYKELPKTIDTKELIIDKVLGGGESRTFTIKSNKGDLLRNNSERKDLSFYQLRGLVTGKIHAICTDRNGNELKTRDFPMESPF
jgi:hypothetical protein